MNTDSMDRLMALLENKELMNKNNFERINEKVKTLEDFMYT